MPKLGSHLAMEPVMKRIAASLVVPAAASCMCAVAMAQPAEPRPVDCRAPRGADETTICRTPDLVAMDGELDRAYRAARVRWTASLSNSIRVMHLDWLKRRQACGADADCIMARIVEEIRELDANRPTDPRWILDRGPAKK